MSSLCINNKIPLEGIPSNEQGVFQTCAVFEIDECSEPLGSNAELQFNDGTLS